MGEAANASTRSCITCHKLERDLNGKLKHCAHCPTALYCSQTCQKADWKQHKLVCAGKAAPKESHNAGFEVAKAFLGLGKDSGLHNLPEKDVFKQLIDSFRMRCEDEYSFAGNQIGIYNQEDPRVEFKRFLDLAESRPGLLPPWWDIQKRKECERSAVDPANWSNINCAVEKSDIQEHYNNSSMPMQLRILAEKIYGKGVM
jgi:mitochondrial splicing suppressor protein 51